ncbi:MAG: hypothetical protein M0Z42_01670 [Actinomycetota bacterium]|jgi:hypothetical protein|nr:hypothetical protein [Actinomycetota bacterium]
MKTGDVLVADDENNVVDEITPSGSLSLLAGTGNCSTVPTPGAATAANLCGITSVAVDSATGDVFVGDQNVVAKVSPSGMLSIVAGTGAAGAPTPGPATSSDLWTPYVAVDSSTGDLYIADSNNHVVEQVTPPACCLSSLAPARSAPRRLALRRARSLATLWGLP